MSIEAIAAASAGAAGAGMPPPDTIQAGPGASIADITSFQSSLTAAGGPSPVGGPDQLSPAIKAMFTQLEKVNGEAKNVADYASQASAKGAEMTPGEIVNLTMKCHEFMFHCQLTSNIANRTSDGVQQLFRQQS
ncbi:hypothetical protein ASG29_02480 [Sphingomonas sp. Leaf412]|uniref:hypothetical protein n=1 Tax=Sphingomonas sp. Leaf412 TaxID=1736370 RepID=UPI0006F350E9|nr:hypothetical protein [Sphingomonas sp. Leaf412]KQT35019.1 hypothetical protein ASG29_02480 [Sphingomonas sp. Leaf412]